MEARQALIVDAMAPELGMEGDGREVDLDGAVGDESVCQV